MLSVMLSFMKDGGADVFKGSQQILIFPLQAVSDKLMAGFVECLDNDEAEEGAEGEEGEAEVFFILLVQH